MNRKLFRAVLWICLFATQQTVFGSVDSAVITTDETKQLQVYSLSYQSNPDNGYDSVVLFLSYKWLKKPVKARMGAFPPSEIPTAFEFYWNSLDKKTKGVSIYLNFEAIDSTGYNDSGIKVLSAKAYTRVMIFILESGEQVFDFYVLALDVSETTRRQTDSSEPIILESHEATCANAYHIKDGEITIGEAAGTGDCPETEFTPGKYVFKKGKFVKVE